MQPAASRPHGPLACCSPLVCYTQRSRHTERRLCHPSLLPGDWPHALTRAALHDVADDVDGAGGGGRAGSLPLEHSLHQALACSNGIFVGDQLLSVHDVHIIACAQDMQGGGLLTVPDGKCGPRPLICACGDAPITIRHHDPLFPVLGSSAALTEAGSNASRHAGVALHVNEQASGHAGGGLLFPRVAIARHPMGAAPGRAILWSAHSKEPRRAWRLSDPATTTAGAAGLPAACSAGAGEGRGAGQGRGRGGRWARGQGQGTCSTTGAAKARQECTAGASARQAPARLLHNHSFHAPLPHSLPLLLTRGSIVAGGSSSAGTLLCSAAHLRRRGQRWGAEAK